MILCMRSRRGNLEAHQSFASDTKGTLFSYAILHDFTTVKFSFQIVLTLPVLWTIYDRSSSRTS